MKIAVLYGGTSGEREVSLSTGKGIIKALENKGHDVTAIDFSPEKLVEILELDVDLVFIGLHGKFGEDGKIQGLLDMLGIPYVGSGVLASALAMDKAKSKQIFSLNGLYTAQSEVYDVADSRQVDRVEEEIKKSFDLPFVIKPNQEGSTLGLTIVKEKEEIRQGIEKAAKSDSMILVEDYVQGKEVTVPVMGYKGKEQALPVIEIIPKNDYYDFDSKYKPGGSEHIVPAKVDVQLTAQLQQDAVLAHQLLGCDVYSRVDFIINEKQEPMILEVNTLPGMTPTSLFPDSAQEIGLSYDDLIQKFVELSHKD
ncbi:D-alanine--D-alanine ligase [Halobacillus karajensis]|uniref:D-alanine--D-alanine ligase n=1 Tax=Halobacillus karajensis TaxID=195088 RepID=A0A024P1E1_9BACI|nr:D-alanine--D-alanine ligase [Halobacillus karajensis]CDQ19473.1 D-alanine--D-alanine ligase B [Halobacillus karajensis]CDQ21935.1 D-alanine--D-alanine ligase B [Halobacillus karajensis]CDQ27776.1 D-alanine--D-alanine ligase B [Halobacillus karajensis]SEH81853.1 D-alanine--D-alanine ligase [Halobacillus karajensis]